MSPGCALAGSALFSGDHLIRLLAGLAVLLFVSRGVLRSGVRRGWARSAAIAVFAVAVCYALVVTLLWMLGAIC
jgi:hypothetical protein